jgi:hypothetical protein
MRQTATLALALLIATAAFGADDTIRRGFDVADGGTLRLETGTGDVRIVTGGRGVAVEVVRRVRGLASDEVLRDFVITFEKQGDDVIARGKWNARWRHWFSNVDVQWNIRIPKRYNVEVTTSGGSIKLDDDIGGTVDARTSGGSITTAGIAGRTMLRTSGGSIRTGTIADWAELVTSGGGITVGGARGKLRVHTSGGSISIANADGDVTARTSGGGIVIDGAAGAVNAKTSGGSIRARISRQPEGDSYLQSSGGGITVTLVGGVAVDLDAEASGGGVRSDVPITISGSQDDDAIRGSINGGGPKLVVRTSGGGIRVKPM